MKVIYDRKAAVEEGYRTTEEISKDAMKRPVVQAARIVPIFTLNGGQHWGKKDYRRDPNGKATNLDFGSYNTSISGFNVNRYDFHATMSNFEFFDMFDSGKDFKKLRYFVYAEKQQGNVVTVRNLKSNDPSDVRDIDLGRYVELAGKMAVLVLSRKKGELKLENYYFPILDKNKKKEEQ